MRILFISTDLNAGSLALRMKEEGDDVHLYIHNASNKEDYDGLLTKVEDWRESLSWVGKDGLIVFDSVGFGREQDMLRRNGYRVFGGSERGERLEVDREFFSSMLDQMGFLRLETKDFNSAKSAHTFVKKNPRQWVIKQNNSSKKNLNYIGELPDGADVAMTLKKYTNFAYSWSEKLTLQERVHGVEVAIGRYFNGKDWIGPIEINFEHPHFLAGGIGPITSEMGTLAWFTNNEGYLFETFLKPFESYLRETNYIGCFDINCIANKFGVYPLEATCRFGSPITHLQQELLNMSWAQFLGCCADSTDCAITWNEGYGIVVLVAIPEFPYSKTRNSIFEHPEVFLDRLTPEDMKHVHFEGIRVEAKRGRIPRRYFVADESGYVLCVTSHGPTVADAQKKAYDIVKKLVVPKMMYRNDIGDKFINEDLDNLIKWGYLSVKDLPFGKMPGSRSIFDIFRKTN